MRPLLAAAPAGKRMIGDGRPWAVAAMVGVLALGAIAVPGSHARAEAGPVCRMPSVVQEMAREIRARNHYSRLDARLINEQPTMIPNLVRCDVCVQLAPYDTPRFGDSPVRSCIAHGFEVQILRAGYVVRDLR